MVYRNLSLPSPLHHRQSASRLPADLPVPTSGTLGSAIIVVLLLANYSSWRQQWTPQNRCLLRVSHTLSKFQKSLARCWRRGRYRNGTIYSVPSDLGKLDLASPALTYGQTVQGHGDDISEELSRSSAAANPIAPACAPAQTPGSLRESEPKEAGVICFWAPG
jgi:hypothetical protein